MTEQFSENTNIYLEHYPWFMKLMREMSKRDWYKNEGWAMFIGYYHAGIYCQVYKPNWYNYSLNGIHIETGFTAESLKEKRLQIDLHVGHENLFDRVTFNERTIPKMKAVVDGWGGDVKFSTKNLSDRLSIWVKFTKTGFAKQVAQALDQVCELAPIIDEGLEGL